MKKLIEIIKQAENNKIAVGHFNVSDLAGLKAIFAASQEASLALQKAERETAIPIIIGVSEGERQFIGVKQIAALIKSLSEEYDYPIYLNADHTKSLEKAEEAAKAGFDAVLFDAGELEFEKNIKETQKAVELIKNINPEILVEGEIGYIGGSSVILKEIPKGAAIEKEDLTTAEQAGRFVSKTGVDLLAPAVGNIHGIVTSGNPKLDIERIVEIKEKAGVPLVLHGASGVPNEELRSAIDAGISVVHINTELRIAWRKGLEKAFKEKTEEITPYKLLPTAMEEIKNIVGQKLRLFNKIN